ncbi:DUF5641 domain-containing protein [Trichonephila clavipes]|nr:DUF5641 domain-containing protein [Trichonephila clavipes]
MLDSKMVGGTSMVKKNNREQWPANEINCEPKDVILEKRKSELVNVNISEELVPCSNSPMSEPVSLPADRVKDANAFDITGIDLAGPLFTRDGGRDGKVRTLKLKCKNSELIRPIQRVYPLEVPFINNEIVKIDGVPTSSVNEDKLTSNAVIKNKVTRSGRLVKIPERLGLFNEVLYAFE